MKLLLPLLLALALLHAQLAAQPQPEAQPPQSVSFKFKPGSASEVSGAASMEANVSRLLTAINVACIKGSALSFAGIRIDPTAQKNLESLWENMHFYCAFGSYVSECLHDHQGLQVRGVKITLRPVAKYDGALERELTVSLTRDGLITGARMALSNNQYKDVMQGKTVQDTRKRMEILKFVEDFRCYYNQKNIDALRQIYANDALIITGSVLQRKGIGMEEPPKVHYRREGKEEYLKRMEGLFKRTRFIDVEFDRISIMHHGTKPRFYGVTLHQTWKTNYYQDEGWLFLLWEFSENEPPVIHVRTWQPDEAAEQDGVFDINDFML